MTTYFIETQGSAYNFADAEQMAGLLEEAKFTLSPNVEEADIVIFNTCRIREPADDAFFNHLEEVKKAYPYKIIIIAGGITPADSEKLKKYPLISTYNIHKVVEVVEEALNDNIVKELGTDELPPLSMPKVRKNPFMEIIPIARGNVEASSLSKNKPSRGNITSYSINEIKTQVERGVKEGVKEIWLTSEDNGSYGFDLQTNLAALLKELIQIPGDFKIHVGTIHPGNFFKIKDELIPLLKHPKVFHYLHLPVQAGSNAILKAMNCLYTKEEYIKAVQELKLETPDLTLVTNIIVGFPGETEEQHWETINLLRTTAPDYINISRFLPLPKTPAAKMEPLPIEVIQHRSKVITDIFHNIAKLQNERWQGWEGEIIIHNKGTEPGQWVGRNDAYKPVLVTGNVSPGQVVLVRITQTEILDLKGEVIP